MKIRTKDGSVIDLAKLRRRCEENVADRSHPLGTIATREDLALLDALEAALSAFVPQSWAHDAVREAVGVLQEKPVAD